MTLTSDTLLSILTTYGNDIAFEIKQNQKLRELVEERIEHLKGLLPRLEHDKSVILPRENISLMIDTLEAALVKSKA